MLSKALLLSRPLTTYSSMPTHSSKSKTNIKDTKDKSSNFTGSIDIFGSILRYGYIQKVEKPNGQIEHKKTDKKNE